MDFSVEMAWRLGNFILGSRFQVHDFEGEYRGYVGSGVDDSEGALLAGLSVQGFHCRTTCKGIRINL